MVSLQAGVHVSYFKELPPLDLWPPTSKKKAVKCHGSSSSQPGSSLPAAWLPKPREQRLPTGRSLWCIQWWRREAVPCFMALTVWHSLAAWLIFLGLKIHQVRDVEAPKPIQIHLKIYLNCNIPKFENFSRIIHMVFKGSKWSYDIISNSASGWRQPLPANRALTVCHSGPRLKILRLKLHQVRDVEGPKPIHILLKNYMNCNIPKFEHFSSIIPMVSDGSKWSLNFKTMQNRF